jgi:GDP-D-mannose 3',5'-epimerase
MSTLVCGAGGFIGGHLVAALRHEGVRDIRAVDIKAREDWWQHVPDVEEVVLDLRESAACREACEGVGEIYNLACDMGGMGFIENHKSACMVSVLINTNLLRAAVTAGVERYLFTSSACVYRADLQDDPFVAPLRERDVYPAMPEDGYGWEKLFSERMCGHFADDYGLETRIVRLHNVYGPHGTWRGGREKAPAAICRKVAEAIEDGTGSIEIWGDGSRTRTFMWIGDAVEGIQRIMLLDSRAPLNLGSREVVTVGELARLVERVAGVRLEHVYRPERPQGVQGRSPDNESLLQATAGWEPRTPLEKGIGETYAWIERELRRSRRRG